MVAAVHWAMAAGSSTITSSLERLEKALPSVPDMTVTCGEDTHTFMHTHTHLMQVVRLWIDGSECGEEGCGARDEHGS